MPTPPKNAKQPADRKPKKEEIVTDISETPGWHLLKDISEVPVWDQTDLLNLMQEAAATEEESKEAGVKTYDVSIIGKLAKALLQFAHDPEEYTKFVSGSKGLQNAMTLAMAWVGQMGESVSSEDS